MGLALIFLVPALFILLLCVLAVCKIASRADCEDDENLPDTYEQPVMDVLNPPGPRYL